MVQMSLRKREENMILNENLIAFMARICYIERR